MSARRRRAERRVAGLIAAAALVCVPAAFALAVPAAAAGSRIEIGTGGPSGVYFVAGNAVCRMVRLQSKASGQAPLNCAAPPSDGSIANLNLLQAGKVDFAVVQSDWQHHAYRGTSIFKGKRRADLRSVFSLHVEPFQIVAGARSGISNWQQLKGKRVNIGNVGSGNRATFEVLLQVHGEDVSKFASATELSSSEQAGALCSGAIDAFAFTVGVPNASIAQATDGCNGRIIDLETPAVKRLIDELPFYSWASIPEGTYATTTKDVRTIGVIATFVTKAAVPESVVYRLVKAVFHNLEQFRLLHPAFSKLRASQMATRGLSAPLHRGAARYFRESGLIGAGK